MECEYKVIKQDFTSFNPQHCYICTCYPTEPPFPKCNEDSCTYFQEKLEEERRKNPPPSPGFLHCLFLPPNSGVQCSMYHCNCSTCGLNPAVKEQREKELAEQKRLRKQSKLSYKIKRFFKKERKF